MWGEPLQASKVLSVQLCHLWGVLSFLLLCIENSIYLGLLKFSTLSGEDVGLLSFSSLNCDQENLSTQQAEAIMAHHICFPSLRNHSLCCLFSSI
jgi:hypothetical protein